MISTSRAKTNATPVRPGLRLWSLCAKGETMSAVHYGQPESDFNLSRKVSIQTCCV